MELDKNIIKNNFKKSFPTYEENAIAQKETARKLVSLIKGKNFDSVLEVGSYSGYLTRYAIENINCRNYSAIDIIEESEFAVKRINPKIQFFNCDIDKFSTNLKFDLILSNASLQWSNSFENVIKKLQSYLQPEGTLALSVFQDGNLSEIKDAFNVGLNYPKYNEIKNMFSKKALIIQVNKVLEFDSSLEILNHLKKTGVNSLKKGGLPILEVKAGLKILEEKYNNKITYKSVIILD